MKTYRRRTSFKAYLIIILSSLLFWSILFNLGNKESELETFQIFIVSTGYDPSMKSELESKGENLGISEFNVYHITYDDDLFSEIFITQGMMESDILILPKSILESAGSGDFIDVTTVISQIETLNETEITTYNLNDQPIGIMIYDDDSQTNLLSDYLSFDGVSEDYYLAINNLTIHAGDLSNQSNQTTDYIFSILTWLLSNDSN